MAGRGGEAWNACADPEEIACNSGVFLIIDEARLISEGLGGADALLAGGSAACLSGEVEDMCVPRPMSADGLLIAGGLIAGGWAGCPWDLAKASSAIFPVAGKAAIDESVSSNSNLTPFSCRIEN